MGRPRKHSLDLELPTGVYVKPTRRGFVFYAQINRKYVPLGSDIKKMPERLADARSGVPHITERQALEFVIPSANWTAEVDDMLFKAQKRAGMKGQPFTIDREHIDAMLKAADFRCAVTKYRFSSAREIGVRIRPYVPSIDRLNNRIGYEPGNIRVVCAFVNVALNQFGVDMLRAAFRDESKRGNSK